MRTILTSSVGLLLTVLACFWVGISKKSLAQTEHGAAKPTRILPGPSQILRQQPRCFVPNLGQWQHGARFVRREAEMTVFIENRGWLLDLRKQVGSNAVASAKKANEPQDWPAQTGHRQKPTNHATRGAAVRMSFVGANSQTDLVGGLQFPGHYNYFLGNDESRWRTNVPRYAEVRYIDLYPGIDVRLHGSNSYFEYDIVLDPGADLSVVSVKVEGADGMRIRSDGTLLIDTPLGPIHQPQPVTWECLADGNRRRIECKYQLLSGDRFGFATPGWDGGRTLVIDPGLLWSTLLGSRGNDYAFSVANDDGGTVTVVGYTPGSDFPITIGAYDTTHNGSTTTDYDGFVSCFDPRKVGVAQLIYSTFLGGLGSTDAATDVSVDDNGVVTLGGYTDSYDFPLTTNAYQSSLGGGESDAFLTRLDPSRTGAAQLIYSTYLGGRGRDGVGDLLVDSTGVVTLVGSTESPDYPTTAGAYDSTRDGFNDGFVTRLDPSLVGKSQLLYSTLVGGSDRDGLTGLGVDLLGIVTVVGTTNSIDFPTTNGAFDRTYNGGIFDGFVSRLDLTKSGSAQLIYSTYLGGRGNDAILESAVDALGIVTVTGPTESSNFPTTSDAFDRTLGGNRDAFVSRLDPSMVSSRQLVYSTYLGGSSDDVSTGLDVNERGVITVGGNTQSVDYPATAGAYSTQHNGVTDIFVSRLNPVGPRSTHMIYSTFLGGAGGEGMTGLAVDPSGVVTLAGFTIIRPFDYPTTSGAFDRTANGGIVDAVASRLDMGLAMWGDLHRLSLRQAGTQSLHVNAGKQHAGRSYWILGSVTGVNPGIRLGSLLVPLNPDIYTDFTISNANSSILNNTQGKLDANGRAIASINVPSGLPALLGFTLHHACVVHDASGLIYMVSNAVPLRLTR